MKKSWGTTEPLLVTPFLEVHRITVVPCAHCSWHKHERKWNAFVVIAGGLRIMRESADFEILRPGDFATIPPGIFHLFAAGDQPAVALEIYYPDTLSEDIIRHDGGGLLQLAEMEKVA